MRGEVQKEKDLLEYALNEFKNVITSKKLGFNRLVPYNYEEVVGEQSETYMYGIMTEAMYERFDAFFGLEDNYGITRESIGKYVYVPHTIDYLMNEKFKEEDYEQLPSIYVEETAKEAFDYYRLDIEGKNITEFISDCIVAKTLEDLNNQLKRT